MEYNLNIKLIFNVVVVLPGNKDSAAFITRFFLDS